MSTRALYTFTDQDGAFHVYKHSDGYPTGGLAAIQNALPYAWPLPRFEADEFAAAFVAGNKFSAKDREQEYREAAADYRTKGDKGAAEACEHMAEKYAPGGSYADMVGGGIRLMPSGEFKDVAPQDLEYRYIICCKNGKLIILVFAVSYTGEYEYRALKNGSWKQTKAKNPNSWTEKKLFSGTLEKALEWAVKYEADKAAA